MTAALEARRLSKTFGGGRRWLGRARAPVCAVREVSFRVARGETLGIVGESGCGKTTLARMLAGLLPPSGGRITVDGREPRGGGAWGGLVQYVFQDPLGALNPRKTIRQIMHAPLRHLLGMEAPAREARIAELFDAVNLRREFLDRYPHEFSGGQAQRIGIARALAANPRIVVLDEPVSALDVSVRAQVLNLLADLQEEFNLAYLFISHDLSVVRHVADEVMVMYLGRIVEHGARDEVFTNPRHPYTRALLSATPVADPQTKRERIRLEGELPSPLNPPPGCPFHPRCAHAEQRCRRELPTILRSANGAVPVKVACHAVEEGRL